MLQGAWENPDEASTLAALGDYLTEQGPGKVELHRLPNWLRLAWLGRRRGDKDRTLRHHAGWAVLEDMGRWLNWEGQERGDYWSLDHFGSVVVGGFLCFASEPYAPVETARAQAQALSQKAGCIGVGLGAGHWWRGTVRVLLFPPPA